MPKSPLGDVLLYLRKVCQIQHNRDLSDSQLLERFLHQRDESAFAVLVKRHGPMVLSLSERLTHDSHTAEDVFQATFLVLARRARSIRKTASLGSWLYGVAQRIALKTRAKTQARRILERRLTDMPQAEPIDDATWQELRPVLDEEIARLPEKYRAPIVLCYFEGKSYDHAAKELGWPKTTLASRLIRARELLREQLVRRGLALTAGVLTSALSEKAGATTVGAMLAINTAKAATSMLAGKAVAGGCVSATAIALAEETVRTMAGIKALVVLSVLTVGLVASGAGLATFVAGGDKPLAAEAGKKQVLATAVKQDQPVKKEAPEPVDLYGDPLPVGATARLGTVRFRQNVLTSVAFSPDGKLLASAGTQGFGVGIWDASTGRPLHRLVIPHYGHSVAFSADSKMLLTGCFASLLDVSTGRELRTFDVGGGLMSGIYAFSPDGKTVAADVTNPTRPTVVVFDTVSGRQLQRFSGHTRFVTSIAYSPDGKTLASGSEDNTIRLWDVKSGNEIQRLKLHEKAVRSVAFSPNGKILASAGEDATVRLWDIQASKQLQLLKGQEPIISSVAFSPDGDTVAAGDYSGIIRFWDPNTGKEARQWPASTSRIYSIAFSPDGKVLASAGIGDSVIHRWDVATGDEIAPVPGHSSSPELLVFTPDGKALFSCGYDKKVLQWDAITGRLDERLSGNPLGTPARNDWIRALDLSPDRTVLAQLSKGNPDYVIRLWSPATGKELHPLAGHAGWVQSGKFSPDGKLLVSAGQDGLRVWDVTTGKMLVHLDKGLETWVAAFSPDGKLLASAGAGKSVSIRDVASWKLLRSWENDQKRIFHLAFSPDGKIVASSNLSGSLRVWTADTGVELVGSWKQGADGMIYAMTFSPSSRVLAVSEFKQLVNLQKNLEEEFITTIRLWETLSGEEIRHFDAPQCSVTSLAFSPNGQALASGGGDSTILLWDMTGQPKNAKSPRAPLTTAQLDSLWSNLAGEAAAADRAIWELTRAGNQGVQLLQRHMRPGPETPADQVAKLVAELDDKNFAVRQKAAKSLDELGEGAESALRKALEANRPLEVRQRLEQILDKRKADVIRKLRAIEVLEQIATPESRQVLETLAKTAPNPRVAETAAAALKRIGKRTR